MKWAEAKGPNLLSPWTWEERKPHPVVANEIVFTSAEKEECEGGHDRVKEDGYVGQWEPVKWIGDDRMMAQVKGT